MKIGVISDTHARSLSDIPAEIVRALAAVDLIIHAGDIVHADVLAALKVWVVRG